jgi:hypothetical protein
MSLSESIMPTPAIRCRSDDSERSGAASPCARPTCGRWAQLRSNVTELTLQRSAMRPASGPAGRAYKSGLLERAVREHARGMSRAPWEPARAPDPRPLVRPLIRGRRAAEPWAIFRARQARGLAFVADPDH